MPRRSRPGSQAENSVGDAESSLGEPSTRERHWYQRLDGLCPTPYMGGLVRPEDEVKYTLRELIIYLIFLILLLIVSLGMTSTTMFYYTKVLSDLFVDTEFDVGDDTRTITFRDATNFADFWAYADTVLVHGFFWDFWYDPEEHKVAPTEDDDKKILFENKMLGLPRLRQVKVRDQSCTVHDDFRRMFAKCYDYYSARAAFTGSFGIGRGTAWRYTSEEALNATSYWGRLATYEGGGFYIDLPLEHEKMHKQIEELKQNLWLDRGSRAVFLEFTVYNANVNLFCIVKLVIEIPPTGGVIPSWSFRTVKLLRYVDVGDFFVLGCEFIFIGYLVYYTVEELREAMYFKRLYLNSFWNLLDLLILGMCYACVGFSVYRYLEVRDTLGALLERQDRHVDFTWLGFYQMQYNNTVAVLVFLAWIKVFKYISFNKTMSQLSNTLSRCAKDVGGFAVMFFVVFCAFAQLGYLLFGTQVAAFSSFIDSVFTLLRTILGDFDYEEIEDANRILGPIFFLSYIFFVFFVLLNMFLAIINDTYSEVKAEIAVKRHEGTDVSGFLSRGLDNVLAKLPVKHKPRLRDDAFTHDQIRDLLRKCNFTELEIEMFFAKYDIDKSKMVSPAETQRMLRDLERRREGATAAGPMDAAVSAAGGVSPDEFYDLEGRVQQIEASVGAISDRVDTIIARLQNRAIARR